VCSFGSVTKMRIVAAIFLYLFGFAANNTAIAQSQLADDPEIASYRIRFNPVAQANKQESQTSSNVKGKPQSKLEVTRRLHASLDSVFDGNKQVKYAQGYRILVYSGTDKTAMNQLKEKVYRLFPNGEVYTVFKQPEYRILYGDFIDKIHAYNHLVKIQTLVTDALIVQEKINIRLK
jgi:hypothetical protein